MIIIIQPSFLLSTHFGQKNYDFETLNQEIPKEIREMKYLVCVDGSEGSQRAVDKLVKILQVKL